MGLDSLPGMRFLRDALVTILALVVAGAILGFLFTRNGLSARADPPALERALATRIRSLSIPSNAVRQRNPHAGDPNAWVDGGRLFQEHCAICHGEDGSGKSEIGKNVYPPAPDMRQAGTQELSDGALYFIVMNGIRYTAMPAWASEQTPDETWKLVSFIRKLPRLTPEELERVTADPADSR